MGKVDTPVRPAAKKAVRAGATPSERRRYVLYASNTAVVEIVAVAAALLRQRFVGVREASRREDVRYCTTNRPSPPHRRPCVSCSTHLWMERDGQSQSEGENSYNNGGRGSGRRTLLSSPRLPPLRINHRVRVCFIGLEKHLLLPARRFLTAAYADGLRPIKREGGSTRCSSGKNYQKSSAPREQDAPVSAECSKQLSSPTTTVLCAGSCVLWEGTPHSVILAVGAVKASTRLPTERGRAPFYHIPCGILHPLQTEQPLGFALQ